jgi:hypothetical protein
MSQSNWLIAKKKFELGNHLRRGKCKLKTRAQGNLAHPMDGAPVGAG